MVVGGTLLASSSFANVLVANAADDQADRIRTHLRRELASTPDEALQAFPESGPTLERAVGEALAGDGEAGRLVGISQPDRDEVVVSVESGLGWQHRCIEVELRGGATVLTSRHSGPC